jgi:hypothetical protein
MKHNFEIQKKKKTMNFFDIIDVINLNGDNAWTLGPSWKSREKRKVVNSSKSLEIRINTTQICV